MVSACAAGGPSSTEALRSTTGPLRRASHPYHDARGVTYRHLYGCHLPGHIIRCSVLRAAPHKPTISADK